MFSIEVGGLINYKAKSGTSKVRSNRKTYVPLKRVNMMVIYRGKVVQLTDSVFFENPPKKTPLQHQILLPRTITRTINHAVDYEIIPGASNREHQVDGVNHESCSSEC